MQKQDKPMTEQEFEKMVREHRGTIYTVCYMFSNDQDEVADLFQEILINLWKGSGTFRGDSALSSWIWKVSFNTCISYDRKKKRGLDTVPLSMDIDLFNTQADDTRQIGLLRDCIRRLGAFDRAIVLLWLEDMSYEEIGQIVGITSNNVSVRLVRIKKEYIKWGRIMVPLAIIWGLWFFWDSSAVFFRDTAIPAFIIISLIVLGITIPLALSKRESIVEKMDELIRQIKELQG